MENRMGTGVSKTPTGTPTERLVWVALWHLGTYWGTRVFDPDIHLHIGGSWRSNEKALNSLLKRGIVERVFSEEEGWWGYRLTLPYAQSRLCPKVDLKAEGYGKKRYDDHANRFEFPEEVEVDPDCRVVVYP
ncbi:MAG TPA: hypothetical protein VGO93_19590 [Candidatus Xenobia bacterium]|jgi:hypothetical protein